MMRQTRTPKARGRQLLRPTALVAAGVLLTVPVPTVDSQTIERPNPPTNVTITPGDNEALITWDYGVDGTCRGTEAFVIVHNKWNSMADPCESTFIARPTSGKSSWYVDELTPSTIYTVDVDVYGKECDNYALLAGTEFTTKAASGAGDPTVPTQRKKKVPGRARQLDVTKSGTTATATWVQSIPGGGKRCLSAVPRLYAYTLDNETDDTVVEENDIHGSAGDAADKQFTKTFSGLIVGKEYLLTIESYSTECNDWSRPRRFKWTQ